MENKPGNDQKYCQHCGQLIDKECVVCKYCGKQVAMLKSEQPNVVINNTNTNTNTNMNTVQTVGRGGRAVNKWVAFLLCLCFGYLGVHKFYEGKTGMGILYLCTCGLMGFGWIIDLILILLKPNPYYV